MSICKLETWFNYTFKRVQLLPMARNTNSNIEKRYKYAKLIMKNQFKNLIFVDEMNLNYGMRKRYGRSVKKEVPRKTITSVWIIGDNNN